MINCEQRAQTLINIAGLRTNFGLQHKVSVLSHKIVFRKLKDKFDSTPSCLLDYRCTPGLNNHLKSQKLDGDLTLLIVLITMIYIEIMWLLVCRDA